MSELYTTKQAAAALGVSEASVRRWSDAGVLPVTRVGRRRARRFAAADVRRFQVADTTRAGARLHDPDRPTSAGRIGLGPHDHVGTFYDSDIGRLRLSVPFLRDGLLAGARCFLVASQKVSDEYFHALSLEPGVEVESALTSGALVNRSGAGTTHQAAISAWEQLWWEAIGAGVSAIRVVGEMATYVGFPSNQEMLDYEVAFDSVAKRFPVATICQYDVREFDGKTILAAIKAHPDAFLTRMGEFLL
jgi:excisionase family DNA binding protein